MRNGIIVCRLSLIKTYILAFYVLQKFRDTVVTSRFLCFTAQFENISKLSQGLAISSPLSPRVKITSKNNHILVDRDLDDLVEEAQAKSTKYATKHTVNVFQGNFCI